ncbi:MAG TPA: helix-turn-helix transcriptional regulator [Thermoanaerobaculia bacterium]|nr:helix-turn-helix transcriptional regulator [Thermoanaerobaculia bacterium]
MELREEILRGLGGRIALLREGKGWSRGELARRLKVTRERLGTWERGVNAPPPESLADLARVLGASIDELLTGRAPVGRLLTPDECHRIMKHLSGELSRVLRLLTELDEADEPEGGDLREATWISTGAGPSRGRGGGRGACGTSGWWTSGWRMSSWTRARTWRRRSPGPRRSSPSWR